MDALTPPPSPLHHHHLLLPAPPVPARCPSAEPGHLLHRFCATRVTVWPSGPHKGNMDVSITSQSPPLLMIPFSLASSSYSLYSPLSSPSLTLLSLLRPIPLLLPSLPCKSLSHLCLSSIPHAFSCPRFCFSYPFTSVPSAFLCISLLTTLLFPASPLLPSLPTHPSVLSLTLAALAYSSLHIPPVISLLLLFSFPSASPTLLMSSR